jgi:autotransporter translocation and assembly factor TamB
MFKQIMVIAVLVAVLLSGCIPTTITGSGNVVTQEESLSGFDSVDVSHNFEVSITQGESYSVVIRVDDNLVEHLDVGVQGSTLKIGLMDNRDYTILNATMEAEVTMPVLTGLELSGNSHAAITGFAFTGDFTVDLSGNSSLKGDIEADDVNFDLSGNSEFTLSGSGGDANISLSGNSVIDLSDFPVADVNIDASGASTATVNVSGSLDVDASGASNVYYLGNPSLGTIDTSGGSSVEPK